MAKTSNSNVQARRLALVAAVENATGLKMKRSATATAGLSVSNESRLLNAYAHLLCNEKNFSTVEWMLQTEIVIPPQFEEKFDMASFGYACGLKPRIQPIGTRHISKDAVKTGLGQEFVCWAQAERVAGVGGLSGLSRSVERGLQFGVVDDNGNLVPTSELESGQMKAAADQMAMRQVTELGGAEAARSIASARSAYAADLAREAIARLKALRAPEQTVSRITIITEQTAPATEEAAPMVKSKKRGGRKAAAVESKD